MSQPWRYRCTFTNRRLGEERVATVTLGASGRNDANFMLAVRGAAGPGGPDGPVARRYALDQAAEELPPDFLHDCTFKVEHIPALRLVN